ncbi:MAG: hypothetical protein N2746_07355 [Deltaproteobacteria bacterium]|nr:hypothetical protein [Deltaproteobacteria bacterium]
MSNIWLILILPIYTDFSAKERLNISTEYDSNVYKRPLKDNELLKSDFNLRLQSDLNLRFSSNKHILKLNIINGGKLFINESDANAIANQGEISYSYKAGKFIPEIGLDAKDTSTIDTIQDYTIIMPFVALNYYSKSLYLKLLQGYERFILDYKEDYSYDGLVSGIITNLSIDEDLSFNANYIFKYNYYDSPAYKKLGDLDKDILLTQKTTNKRRDSNHNLLLRLNYESDIIIFFSYNPEINTSNSAGESVFRQRFQLSMTSLLFFKIYINMLISIMISSFKDGILISDELLLINDSENRNYIIIKLSREIYKKTMIEFKYSYYYSEFSNYITQFNRTVISLGFCFKF